MTRLRPDFVMIQLSAAGRKMAGDHGVVRWANSRRHFEFKAGEPQEIERSFEWKAMLVHERFQGEPIFEIAELVNSNEAIVEAQPELSEGKNAE